MNDEIEKLMPKSRRQDSNYSFGVNGPINEGTILSRGNSLFPDPLSVKKNNGHSNYNTNGDRKWLMQVRKLHERKRL